MRALTRPGISTALVCRERERERETDREREPERETERETFIRNYLHACVESAYREIRRHA